MPAGRRCALCLQAAWAGGGAKGGSGDTWGRLLWGLPAEGVDGVARIWGCRVIRGRVGSVHVSLRVGGGEDVGGWELISWSLVSVQSLDASPRLAASSHPAPAPPPSLTVTPHLPQSPRSPPPALPPRDGQQSHLEASGAVCRVRARGEHRGPPGRKEVPAPRWLPSGPGWPADPAGEGPHKQPRSRGGEGPNPLHGARGAETVCRPPPHHPPGTLVQAPPGFQAPGSAWAGRGCLPQGGPLLCS